MLSYQLYEIYNSNFIALVQYKDEAVMIRRLLEKCMEKFGLELPNEKTRIIEFCRYVTINVKKARNQIILIFFAIT